MTFSSKQRQLLYFGLLIAGLIIIPLHLVTIQLAVWQTVLHRGLHLPLLVVYAFITLLLGYAVISKSALIKRADYRWFGIIAAALLFHWMLPPVASAHPVLLLTQLWMTIVLTVLLVGSMPTVDPAADPAIDSAALVVTADHNRNVSTVWRTAFVVYIIAAVVVCVFLSARVPRMIMYDEPAEFNFAYALAHSGGIRWPFYGPYESPIYAVFTWPVDALAGQFMRVVGFGAPQFRLFYLLIAWTALVPLYGIAKSIHSRRAGVIATALGLPVIALSLYARASTITFVCATFALWVLCEWIIDPLAITRRQIIRAVLIGFLVCLGYEGHPYTLRYVITFGLAVFAIAVWRAYRSRAWSVRLLAAPGAVVLGGLLYLPIFYLLHWLPVINLNSDLVTTLRTTYASVQNYTSSTPLERIWLENNEQFTIFIRDQLPLFLITVATVAATILRPVRGSRFILVIWVACTLIGAVLMAHANYHYHLFGVLFLVSLAAISIASMNRPLLYLTLALAITWGWIFAIDRTPDSYREVLPIAQQIDKLLPSDVSIMGIEPLFWGMTNRAFHYRNTTTLCDLQAISSESRPNFMLLAWPDALMGDPCAPVHFWIASAWKMKAIYCFQNVAGETVYILQDESMHLPERPDLTCPPLPAT